MKIILVKDIEHVGKAGQTVTVKDGYARNFLIPQELALPATASHRAKVDTLQRQQARQAEALKERAAQLAGRLETVACVIPVSVGDQGKLHGAVTAGDIQEALEKQGIHLEKHRVVLEEPITQLGIHPLVVKLHPEVSCTLQVSVIEA